MAKAKVTFKCTSCGATYPKWMGRCTHCGEFSTIEEVKEAQGDIVSTLSNMESVNRYGSYATKTNKVENLGKIAPANYQKISTGLSELDRALSGGFVDGGVALLGGSPGIGKSTLLLQTISYMSQSKNVLYVSGEESAEQIALRGKRLNLDLNNINIYCEVELEKIMLAILETEAKYVIIDSIQTLYTNQSASAPGSVSQVKECATHLNRIAKERGICMIIICHVTKEGELAGPRALEHIVDTVLIFEGEQSSNYRMIRAVKNRFGQANEIGVFEMTAEGLIPVDNPSGIFVNTSNPKPGSVLFMTECNRPLLVEVQALLDDTPLPNPIRRAIGMDMNRLQMLCAVIHKYCDLPIYTQNVFINVVGGMKFDDTGIDLPSIVAMISSYTGKRAIDKTVFFGEVGLTCELKPVSNTMDRIREAARFDLKRIVTAKQPNSAKIQKLAKELGVTVIECPTLSEVISASFG